METLTVLDNATLVFRGNVAGDAELINSGNIVNNGEIEIIGGDDVDTSGIYSNTGTTTNHGTIEIIGGDGDLLGGRLWNVNPDATIRNHCAASIPVIGPDESTPGQFLNEGGDFINQDSEATSADGLFLLTSTGVNSGTVIGNPITEKAQKCYCHDLTIADLLESPSYTRILDNRDGSLGVILEGEKKENNLVLASDIGGSIIGGDKADCLIGGDGTDLILGGKGNDQIFGKGEDDGLKGGQGNDRISGGDGNDAIFGGKHNDRLSGGDGDDLIFGEKGKDVLKGNSGIDTMDGGDNNDTCITDADDPAPTTCETIS